VTTTSYCSPAAARSTSPPPPSTYAAPDPGSSDCSACSRTGYGARKSRYIGAAKARLQAAWAAALVNLNPIAHTLTAT
jgi:hypothetical protein